MISIGCKKDCPIVSESGGIEACKEGEICVSDIDLISIGCITDPDAIADYISISSGEAVTEFIVNSATDEQELRNYWIEIDGLNCVNYKLPSIDYTQKTLLGKLTTSRGNPTYKIVDDQGRKEYLYTIRLYQTSLGSNSVYKWHWMVIPKVPADYEVIFIIEELECN